jgi:hypothetical protein
VQLVEIIEADIDIKSIAPVIFDALVIDMASGRKILYAIGSTAKRRWGSDLFVRLNPNLVLERGI